MLELRRIQASPPCLRGLRPLRRPRGRRCWRTDLDSDNVTVHAPGRFTLLQIQEANQQLVEELQENNRQLARRVKQLERQLAELQSGRRRRGRSLRGLPPRH